MPPPCPLHTPLAILLATPLNSVTLHPLHSITASCTNLSLHDCVQAVMMVEVLPITPNPICALCWLPGSMIQARKLLVKPLVAPEQLKQADKQAS